MFPEVRIPHMEPVLWLIPFVSGLGADVKPPGSKSIYRLFPNGCYNVDQRQSREALHLSLQAFLITPFRL